MKYTNIKKLLIKFMGGGLINFPTRFLRWIKIDGDAEGDDGGDNQNINVLDYFPFDFSDDKPIGFVILKNWDFKGNDFPDGVDSRTYEYVIDDDVVIHPMKDLTNEFYQQYRKDNNTNDLRIVLLYENYQENAIVQINWGTNFASYSYGIDIMVGTRKTEIALINNGHIYYMATTEH